MQICQRGRGCSDEAMLQAANKLLKASKMRIDSVPIATPAGSSTKLARKYRQASLPKIDAPTTDIEEASTQVSNDDMSGPQKSPLEVQKSKLLVFNIHGILLDCSLIDEPNPNTNIWYTMKTTSRRVVCRPWLAQFLSNYFLHFEVAFWIRKSAKYMEEIVPAMLRRSHGDNNFEPCLYGPSMTVSP